MEKYENNVVRTGRESEDNMKKKGGGRVAAYREREKAHSTDNNRGGKNREGDRERGVERMSSGTIDAAENSVHRKRSR